MSLARNVKALKDIRDILKRLDFICSRITVEKIMIEYFQFRIRMFQKQFIDKKASKILMKLEMESKRSNLAVWVGEVLREILLIGEEFPQSLKIKISKLHKICFNFVQFEHLSSFPHLTFNQLETIEESE